MPNLGDYSSIRNAADYVRSKYPRIDILINNAGFIFMDRQMSPYERSTKRKGTK